MIPISTPEAAFQALAQVASLFEDEALFKTVKDIQSQVQEKGDAALLQFSQTFDKVPANFKMSVTSKEIEVAYQKIDKAVLKSLKMAKKNLIHYHRMQRPKSWQKMMRNGVVAGMQYRPIERVGLYVPGGRAIYPSTVLMNAIPAQLAGVKERVMVSPPRSDGSLAPEVIVAAVECGITHIFKIGGAQAVFALAYGTPSIPKVDKIVGPGNRYVTLAKQWVYGQVDIDKPAGPSEALVYIEDAKYAAFAASELLAQLEHDPAASAVAISPSKEVLSAIQTALTSQIRSCNRQEILTQSIQNARLILTANREESLHILNKIASEHVVIMTDDAQEWLPDIHHAGAIFLGPYTPVALGDYWAGPNHVLPTAQAARFSSPLSVWDFVKFSSILGYSQEALKDASPHIQRLASTEGLDAHAKSITTRISLF
jgi:histidinol dehydrogenase